MLHMITPLNWKMGNYTQIRKKKYEQGKKNQNQVTTRNNEKKNYRVYRLDQTTDKLQITV